MTWQTLSVAVGWWGGQVPASLMVVLVVALGLIALGLAVAELGRPE